MFHIASNWRKRKRALVNDQDKLFYAGEFTKGYSTLEIRKIISTSRSRSSSIWTALKDLWSGQWSLPIVALQAKYFFAKIHYPCSEKTLEIEYPGLFYLHPSPRSVHQAFITWELEKFTIEPSLFIQTKMKYYFLWKPSEGNC